MSADGVELAAYSRGVQNSGEELNDEGLRAIRLVFSQCGLAKSIPPDEVSDGLKMCINTQQSMFYLSFPSPCVSKLIG